MLASQGLTSADSGEPTGVVAPADALGEPKRMSTENAEGQESYECPTCGRDDFGSRRAMRLHHYRSHGESLAYGNFECKWCGSAFEELKCKTNRFCSRSCADKGRLHVDKPWTDEPTLRRLYLDECMSATEIAENFGCGHVTVAEWLDKFHVREDLDNHNCPQCDKGFHQRSALTQHVKAQHNADFDTLVDTECGKCGCAISVKPSVYNKTQENFCGSDCRNAYWDGNRPSGENHPQYQTSEYECDNCGKIVERAPSEVVGEIIACSRDCFTEVFDPPEGEEHPSWKGGYSSRYGPKWGEKRRQALERDNYTCQGCGRGQSGLKNALSVHHIRPFREFDTPDDAHDLNNLVTLCPSCHGRWEGVPLRPQLSN